MDMYGTNMYNTYNYRTNTYKTNKQLKNDLNDMIGHCNTIGVCIQDPEPRKLPISSQSETSTAEDKWWIYDKVKTIDILFGNNDEITPKSSPNLLKVRFSVWWSVTSIFSYQATILRMKLKERHFSKICVTDLGVMSAMWATSTHSMKTR